MLRRVMLFAVLMSVKVALAAESSAPASSLTTPVPIVFVSQEKNPSHTPTSLKKHTRYTLSVFDNQYTASMLSQILGEFSLSESCYAIIDRQMPSLFVSSGMDKDARVAVVWSSLDFKRTNSAPSSVVYEANFEAKCDLSGVQKNLSALSLKFFESAQFGALYRKIHDSLSAVQSLIEKSQPLLSPSSEAGLQALSQGDQYLEAFRQAYGYHEALLSLKESALGVRSTQAASSQSHLVVAKGLLREQDFLTYLDLSSKANSGEEKAALSGLKKLNSTSKGAMPFLLLESELRLSSSPRKALALAKEALGQPLYSEYPDLSMRLSAVLETLGQADEAQGLRKKAFAKAPEASYAYEIGIHEKDEKTAVAMLESAHAKNPSDVKTLTALGDRYRAMKNYDKGIDAYRALSSKFPDDPNYLSVLGQLYILRGSKEKQDRQVGLSLLQEALSLNPNHQETLDFLGRLGGADGQPSGGGSHESP